MISAGTSRPVLPLRDPLWISDVLPAMSMTWPRPQNVLSVLRPFLDAMPCWPILATKAQVTASTSR